MLKSLGRVVGYCWWENESLLTSSIPGNFTANPPTPSPNISVLNKYVVIGILCICLSLLLVAVFVHLVKSKFLSRDSSLLYSQVTSDADTDTASLEGSDDDLDQLYTTCELHVVDDDELVTDGAADFEYDTSSLDGGLSVAERQVLVNALRGDIQSNMSNRHPV